MSRRYENLLSPFRVGNIVFKNRMMASMSRTQRIQGKETYPTEAMITHFANKARNGAAVVTCGGAGLDELIPVMIFHRGYECYRVADKRNEPSAMPADPRESYFSQLTEAIHFYGGKASMQLSVDMPEGYDVCAGIRNDIPREEITRDQVNREPVVNKELTQAMLDDIAEEFAMQSAFLKAVGFDMVTFRLAATQRILGRFLVSRTNKRTDQFGGSLENRARFPLMVIDRIKQRCGPDFLIEGICEVSSGPMGGGLPQEELIECARIFAGHADLYQVRGGEIGMGKTPESRPYFYSEAVKKSGAKIAVVTLGGYVSPDLGEDVIASGKADFVSMSRAWISNPDYGRKIYEGRADDIVPCLKCQKCHANISTAPIVDVCSVNPAWGLEHKIERMIEPPTDKKKVAVVGGGPAGMEAALVAAGRGHQVTLYEKSDTLGGLLNTTNNATFKWTVKAFKSYLIRQIGKSNVRVYLDTEATPEMLRKDEYDVVLVAVGTEPVVPGIPGINVENVVYAKDVYGNESALAENVVVIGGGEVGVETGLYLAEKEHQVTVLEKLDMLAPNYAPIGGSNLVRSAMDRQANNFKTILQANCNGIGANYVTYIDNEGKEQTIPAGSVVVAAGMKPNIDLAMRFTGTGDMVCLIGGCNGAGNIQKIMRNAFSTASML